MNIFSRNPKIEEIQIAEKQKKWEEEKVVLEKKYQLKQDKQLLKQKNRKKMSTSKSLIIFLFANCTAIEIFTAGVTLYSLILSKTTLIAPDFTPLTTLISAIVGEVIGYAIYSIKAAQENKQGGIVYEKAMQEGDKN